MGRQGVQTGHAVHGWRPRDGSQDGRGTGGQVRRGKENRAARLREGQLTQHPTPSFRGWDEGALPYVTAQSEGRMSAAAAPQSAPQAQLAVNNIEVIYDHVILV